jgi:hypothetical protein
VGDVFREVRRSTQKNSSRGTWLCGMDDEVDNSSDVSSALVPPVVCHGASVKEAVPTLRKADRLISG